MDRLEALVVKEMEDVTSKEARARLIRNLIKDYKLEVLKVYRRTCDKLKAEIMLIDEVKRENIIKKLNFTNYFDTCLPTEVMQYFDCIEYKQKAIDVLDEYYLKGELTFMR